MHTALISALLVATLCVGLSLGVAYGPDDGSDRIFAATSIAAGANIQLIAWNRKALPARADWTFANGYIFLTGNPNLVLGVGAGSENLAGPNAPWDFETRLVDKTVKTQATHKWTAAQEGDGWVFTNQVLTNKVLAASVNLVGRSPADVCGQKFKIITPLAYCGDKVLNGNEKCDGGAGCKADCTCDWDKGYTDSVPLSAACGPICGNGKINPAAGEQCDGGLNCNAMCKCPTGFVPTNPVSTNCVPLCGNGAINSKQGEECDGGAGCDANCKCTAGYTPYPIPRKLACIKLCGNGQIDEGEACDGGANCNADCTCASGYHSNTPADKSCVAKCGDGIVTPGESCDGGAGCNSQCKCVPGFYPNVPATTACKVDKKKPSCGTGDPHYLTYDGIRFDLQSRGDFHLVNSSEFDIQVKHVSCNGNINTPVACILGVAYRAGGHTVEFRHDYQSNTLYYRHNGAKHDVTTFPTTVEFGTGVGKTTVALSSINGRITVTFDKMDLYIDQYVCSAPDQPGGVAFFFNVYPYVSERLSGHLGGILGNADENQANDFHKPDGTLSFAYPAGYSVANIISWAEYWRAAVAVDLFDLGLNVVPENAVATPHTLEPEFTDPVLEAQATALCNALGLVPEQVKHCLFDVAGTGDIRIGQAYAAVGAETCTENCDNALGNCPDNCNFHGQCVNRACVCDNGFTGTACQTQAGPNCAGTGSLSGNIYDSVGVALSGASVTASAGDCDYTATVTGSSYMINGLPNGAITVTATRDSYVDAEAEFTVAGATTGKHLYLSAVQAAGSLRAILTWDGEADLDAFYTTDECAANYDNPQCTCGGSDASLDVDSSSDPAFAMGPETMSITNAAACELGGKFDVLAYQVPGKITATVRVYSGATFVGQWSATFSETGADADYAQGDFWNVFVVNNGQVVVA